MYCFTHISCNVRIVSFAYECLFLLASLETARKSAADANYHTTDDERLGKGRRQHVQYHRYSSDEEDYDNRQKCKNKSKCHSSICYTS